MNGLGKVPLICGTESRERERNTKISREKTTTKNKKNTFFFAVICKNMREKFSLLCPTESVLSYYIKNNNNKRNIKNLAGTKL
jgi:hypothetical protein